MSDNPPCQDQSSMSMPSSWQSFISECVGDSSQKWEKFPMKGLLSLSSSSMAPKIKQLLQVLPMIHSKYSLNPVYFRELIILLCYLLMKGCANTSQKLINICMSVLQQLLGWRLVVICGGIQCEMLVSVWDYMNIWIGMLVPAIFASNAFTSKQTNKKKQKNRDQQDNKLNGKDVPKSFVQIIRNVNMDKFNERDQLLLIFESLVVHKIRKHLTHQSLFQFDRIMRKVYTQQKFSLIYQGKGCVTHIQNKEKEKKQRQRQIGQGRISLKLVLPRVKEQDWKTFDVQAYLNEGREGLKIRKVTAGHNIQQWVIDSFQSNLKPSQIKLSLISLLTRMKAIEVYKFLCLLEIYGYSPNIQFLDEYIIDQKLLLFFTTFLLNGNLVKSAFELLYPQSLSDSMDQMRYSYCDKVFVGALQRCLNEGKKLRGQEDKQIFVKQFRAKLLMESGEKVDKKNKGRQNKGGNTRLEQFWGE